MKGQHFTAEDVHAHFESKQISIGIATIYRQLEKLVAEGTLQKYFIDEHSAACFEYSGEDCNAETPHFHLKCEECGNLFHLECEDLESLSNHLKKVICNAITEALCQKDNSDANVYRKNLSVYTAQLDELDKAYSTAINSASKNTLIFGDRFPFRYLVDDYNLNYYAAFVGCSAETEASFKTVIFLANKIDELGANYIFKIESGDGKLSKTIIQNSSNKYAQILVLDSMQSVTSKQALTTSYLKIMNENLQTLKKGLE